MESESVLERPFFRVCYFAAVLLVCFAAISCGLPSKNVQLAQDSVGLFHAQLDSEQYSAIYAACDEKFHQATSESDFVRLLQAVHGKLGFVRQSNLRNTGIAWFAGQGTTVTLVYDTTFANGSGTEQFVWHIGDGRATLYGYHINSNDLVAK